MARFKTTVVTLFAFVAILAVIPGAVLAARSQARTIKAPPTGHVFGGLVSISASGAVISTKAGDIAVVFKPVVAYVSYDQAAALAGITIGDQVDASGTFRDGTLHADRLRYDTVAFPVSNVTKFDGRYSASTATTLTLQLTRKRTITFNVDANTRYFMNGHRLTGPPTYQANEHIKVWAREYSNQTWLAGIVDVIIPPSA
jgi:Domain of unknown function (DUF5666)